MDTYFCHKYVITLLIALFVQISDSKVYIVNKYKYYIEGGVNYMKKLLSLLAGLILVLSGLGAVALPKTNEILEKEESVLISEPIIKEVDNYLAIDLEESTSMLLETGKPIIPVVTKTFTFPLGTNIIDVKIDLDMKKYALSKKIQPSPEPVFSSDIYDVSVVSEFILDEEVYSSLDPYPLEQYSIQKRVGLKNGERVLSLNVRVNSQYLPAADMINIPTNICITIKYLLPEYSIFTADEYDMLIITDEKFAEGLQPLVDHKNKIGIRTVLETTQEIYPSYNGRDDAEDIKLRIADAIEDWGIDYVLLAGGRKGQTFEWYIPERRTNNGDSFEGGYASDLYYADVYKDEEGLPVFEDWDSNGNGVFAEFSNLAGKGDIIDYYPDVTVGRLPFRYSFEVETVVNKIIDYENNADDAWFKKSFVVGGDGGPPARGYSPGIYEDELECDFVADLLGNSGFNVEKLYTSLGTFASREDVINGITNGAGFFHMSGHGNPAYWGNFLPDAETEEGMIDGLILRDMNKLKNGDKLPVITVGGCHNAQFNVTMMNIIEGIKKFGINGMFFGRPYRFFYNEWVPRCFCSWLVFQKGGGAIGSIGNTGLGIGYVNYHWNAGLSGWIMPRFYDAYTNQSKYILGEVHDQAIIDYIDIIGGVNSDDGDRKTVEEWILIGDPSLRLGGYE